MRIDDQVEPLVREPLTAVVKRDAERLERAFGAFQDDERVACEAVQLAIAIALYVLQDQYGTMPTDSELRAVAQKLVEMERWADVSADEVVALVKAATAGRRGDEVLPMEKVVTLPFIVAGNFVSGFRREDEKWWDYLDRAEATIESR